MRAALKAIVQVQSPWFDFIWNMYASVAACTADSFDLAEGYLKEAARLLDSHRMNYFSVMLQAGEAYRLLRMG
jgi:hypothetical protein